MYSGSLGLLSRVSHTGLSHKKRFFVAICIYIYNYIYIRIELYVYGTTYKLDIFSYPATRPCCLAITQARATTHNHSDSSKQNPWTLIFQGRCIYVSVVYIYIYFIYIYIYIMYNIIYIYIHVNYCKYIWLNYNHSPTWNLWNAAMWGWFPLTIIPATSRCEVIIINPDVNLHTVYGSQVIDGCVGHFLTSPCVFPQLLHFIRGSHVAVTLFLAIARWAEAAASRLFLGAIFGCLSQEVWPVHGKITCNEWDQPARVVSKNPWIGFLGKILTGNPWFLPSNIEVSCKFSRHPILWKKGSVLLPVTTVLVIRNDIRAASGAAEMDGASDGIPNCGNAATPLGFTLGSIIDKGRPFFPVAKVVVNRLRHEKYPVSNPNWLIHGHP